MIKKGIILAGGSGSRLYPLTLAVTKQLLPIYDKPLIYYSLSALMLAGIRDFLMITTPQDRTRFQSLLGDGSHLGVSITYETQDYPRGLADAFLIGETFIGSDSVALILGDNIFYGNQLAQILRDATRLEQGACVFAYHVENPTSYAVIEFDSKGRALSLEEKPARPKSNWSIPGIYFYDNQVVDFAKDLQPSKRGELEITAINQIYLENKQLRIMPLGRGIAWWDAGTHDSMLNAANFVASIQTRQGIQICLAEEIAYRMGFIDSEQLQACAERYKNTHIGRYLQNMIDNEDLEQERGMSFYTSRPQISM